MHASETKSGFYRSPGIEAYRAVLDASPLPAFVLRWSKILHINRACFQLLGADAEQVIYRSVLGFSNVRMNEEDERRTIRSLIHDGGVFSLPIKSWVQQSGKWVKQPGRTIYAEVHAWSVPLNDGSGVQVTLTDVTESIGKQEKETRSDEQMHLAVDSSALGLWDYDPVSDRLRYSHECGQIFGLPWDETVTLSDLFARLHPEDRVRTNKHIHQSFNPDGDGEFGCDCRVLCPDGGVRWVAAKGHAFFARVDGKRQAVRLVGTALDITHLRQTDASLRQTEKLAATGRLAAALAHEINNPLESITNLLYLLEDSSPQQEQKKYIKLAQQELGRVVDIATQTLRFYRDPSAPQRCNLMEILESVLTLFGGRIQASHIQVQRRYSSHASVVGAKEELRQVFVNLIHNAIDAMPRGGKLQVRARETTNWHTGRTGVRLTIADTGHGMDRATRHRLFEPFFTTKDAVGVGLGLWLSAGVVEQHGGTIAVKSRRDPDRSGTVFSIFLPLDRRSR